MSCRHTVPVQAVSKHLGLDGFLCQTIKMCCCRQDSKSEQSKRNHKSEQREQDENNDAKRPNPFLPYEEALWVQHLSPTHTLLLNKYNVVAHHVLVVTRQFESQQDPLNARDLEATMKVGGV